MDPQTRNLEQEVCITPSPAHLHDTYRTSTIFIKGENSATTPGIKSKITTQDLGLGGA